MCQEGGSRGSLELVKTAESHLQCPIYKSSSEKFYLRLKENRNKNRLLGSLGCGLFLNGAGRAICHSKTTGPVSDTGQFLLILHSNYSALQGCSNTDWHDAPPPEPPLATPYTSPWASRLPPGRPCALQLPLSPALHLTGFLPHFCSKVPACLFLNFAFGCFYHMGGWRRRGSRLVSSPVG